MNRQFSPIVFIDSGIGGLKYLQWIKDKYPYESYIYIADSANFPYGEKSPVHLRSIIEKLAMHLEEKFSPKAVVTACNTATLTACDLLEKIFKCPITGVQPILSQEIREKYQTPIAVLATEASIRKIAPQNLLPNENLIFCPAGVLVNFVENYWISSSREEKELIIRPFTEEFLEKNVRTVTLSCTHFLYLKNEFQNALPDVFFVDYLEETEKAILQKVKLNTKVRNWNSAVLYQTASCRTEQYEFLCASFGLKFGGRILI